jgi:hypothetical protein
MSEAPERIWATPFDGEMMGGGTYCDAVSRPLAPNKDAYCYIRADLVAKLVEALRHEVGRSRRHLAASTIAAISEWDARK